MATRRIICVPDWARMPECEARGFELMYAFDVAGFSFTHGLEGWHITLESGLEWYGDTLAQDIDRYVFGGIGNIASIVAIYVKSADLSGY